MKFRCIKKDESDVLLNVESECSDNRLKPFLHAILDEYTIQTRCSDFSMLLIIFR